MKLIFVRSGSAILFSEFGQKPATSGDVVLLSANTLCGSEPEGHITVTTIYLDTDYVIDQVFWQHAGLLQDRLDAQGFAERVYSEPAQILRLGEKRAGMLMPWLDELVERSIDGGFARNFYRMQALWFNVAHVVAPFVNVSPVRISASQRAHIRPTLPRHRQFAPLRAEARRAAELLHQAPAKQWTLHLLAARVHLSPSQLSRVFTDAYGKTPLAYLTMLRAENLAKSLRETDLSIETAMREVGWRSRGHAAQQFRKYVGLTPTRYRQLTLRAS
ncbi:helix-turn-helix domain-containing protein [Antrihabitans spumae]|uniref:Helix-turn-helix domain-containing protein n=1 Tax=Antrihabitans spumae TaxID=3373370 RepID=A0ABW7KVF3_9NOCA